VVAKQTDMQEEAPPEHATETSLSDSVPPTAPETSVKSYKKEYPLDKSSTAQDISTQTPSSEKSESRTSKSSPLQKISETARSRPTTYIQHRELFVDGWNSLWHVVIGFFALKIKLFVPMFIAYQFLDIYEKNVFIDVYEFIIGYFLGYIFMCIPA
jgi:hypothetical protein